MTGTLMLPHFNMPSANRKLWLSQLVTIVISGARFAHHRLTVLNCGEPQDAQEPFSLYLRSWLPVQ
jgi:hypothetical protein